jgi:hypothetical protein
MRIKDKIGTSITNYLFPYLQDQFMNRGENMPKRADEREKFKLKENYLWFLGQEDLLADFYQTRSIITNLIDVRAEYYYSNASNNIRIVHSGLPNLISNSKAKLLLGGGIEYYVEKSNDIEDKPNTELLEAIYEDNKLGSIIKNSVLVESWGKTFAWKISNDETVSDYPIVELYKPFSFETVTNRGRLQKVIFKNEYEKNNTKYELQEDYGYGYVDYFLYQKTENGMIPVELTELEETAELQRVTFNKKFLLAGVKELDKTDYDGLISEFDALDEAWSQLMDEIRLGRSETYIPDVLTDHKQFNKFRKNFVELGTDERENGKNEIKHIQPEIRSEQYSATISLLTNNILISVGLSPFTVGINDNIGANVSGATLDKMEMASLRTREDMTEAWEDYLEELFDKLLFAYALFNGKTYKQLDISVSFGDYISPTRAEAIANAKILVDSSIIDAEKALEEVYGDDLSEEEKLRILAYVGSVSFQEQPVEETPIEE